MGNGSDDLQRPLGKWPFRATLGALAALVLTGLFLLGKTWIDEQVGALGLAVLLMLFLISLLFALSSTQVIPWGQKPIPHWLQPRVLGAIGMAIILALGTAFSALPMLEDKGGAKQALAEIFSRLGSIEQGVDQTQKDTGEIKNRLGIGNNSLIRRTISGTWGEPGCEVIYRFALKDNALLVESVLSKVGQQPYAAEFTIENDQDLVSNGPRQARFSTTEQKGFFPGMSVEFLIEDNGSSPVLTWTHQGQFQNPLRLERCVE